MTCALDAWQWRRSAVVPSTAPAAKRNIANESRPMRHETSNLPAGNSRRRRDALEEEPPETARAGTHDASGAFGAETAELVHEIKQPLSAIAGFAGACIAVLQQMDHPQAQQLAQWNAKIQRQVAAITEIIRRTSADNPHMDFAPCDLQEIARESAELMHGEARGLGVRIELTDSPPVVCQGSRGAIQQVVVNLLRNACEAAQGAEPQGIVRVRASALADRARLEVRDNGPGVPAELRERAFAAFHTTKPDGMGLGLAISRSIIEAHAGKLWFTSRSGEGATFQFEIPAKASTSKD
jgi:signal transduction histidine kinase